MLPRRDIRLTPYDKQGEAPVTHIQLGLASPKIDAAQELMVRATREMDESNARGEYMMLQEWARMVRDASFADELVWEAMDLLAKASGGSFARNGGVLHGYCSPRVGLV